MSRRRGLIGASGGGAEYITDGLVLLLDGENNTRNGHNSATTIWEDLSGNGHDFVPFVGLPSWQIDHAHFDGAYGLYNSDAYLHDVLRLDNHATVEIVFSYNRVHVCGIFNPSTYHFYNTYLYVIIASAGSTDILTTQYYSDAMPGVLASDYVGKIISLRTFFENGNPFADINGNDLALIREGSSQNIAETKSTYIGTSVGWDGEARWLFEGDIYSIRVYDRVLTEEERENNLMIDKKRFGIV